MESVAPTWGLVPASRCRSLLPQARRGDRPAHQLRTRCFLPGRERRDSTSARDGGTTSSSHVAKAAAVRCPCTAGASRRRTFARNVISTFEAAGVDHVVVNAAGCGSSMKGTASCSPMSRRWPGGQPPWPEGPGHHRDPGRAGTGGRAAPAADVGCLSRRVTWRMPKVCAHNPVVAQRHPRRRAARDREPRAVLRIGRRLQPVEPRGRSPLGDAKAANILATDADLLVTANPVA